MEPDAYKEMAACEESHWWFRGRRAVTATVIQNLGLPLNARILEIGSGTGGNLAMLAEFGSVQAGELDESARVLATQKTGVPVIEARLPDHLPFPAGEFDLVCLFDVLEHVTEDIRSLVAIRTLLRPTGRLLITVPAHPWLWGAHDRHLHHVRRYSRRTLADAAAAAGYRITWVSYFNVLLFPVAVATRIFDRAFKRSTATGAAVPAAWVNALLFRVMAQEASWLSRWKAPFGMSLVAVLEAT